MKTERKFPFAVITKKQELRVKDGHPWIYADEITDCSGEIENGSIVDVFGQKHNYLGSGFYSEKSLIRIRLLGRNANDSYDDAFFERRVGYALKYRRDVMKEDFNACRLIHGESDGLPGLTVDRYEDILVAECASFGMETKKDVIYRALKDQLSEYGINIRGLYERNEGELRKKEGLEQYKGWYEPFGVPESPEVEITENGLKYLVDVENGQKTGFFLDQKYNRLAVRKMAEGKRVLDCCTHTGSFAMNAAMGGALSVTASDISESALEQAKANAELNGLNIDFIQADVFELLPKLREEHQKYDFIILDPPAFTKSRKTFHNARNGYRSINAMAMKFLERGSYLATCSCSHFMPAEEFKSMLKDAAGDAGVSLKIVEERHASPDHPEMIGIPETDYLKFFLVQIN